VENRTRIVGGHRRSECGKLADANGIDGLSDNTIKHFKKSRWFKKSSKHDIFSKPHMIASENLKNNMFLPVVCTLTRNE
jgi:hypothetical protein